MTTYVIDSQSRVDVQARSSIHDTNAALKGVTGTIETDAASLAEGTASAVIAVDLGTADTGDWLKNRKLRKDLGLDKDSVARFELSAIEGVSRDQEAFHASARGVLTFRGRSVPCVAAGQGTLGDDRLSATATFELDVTELGITPPKFLLWKVENVVSVTVQLSASATR